jgi:hypothetical protein
MNAHFCHYCNHKLGGSGLYASGNGAPSGRGLFASGDGGSGGSLKSIGNALKSGNVGKIFSPSANHNTASDLIHQGIPVATGSLVGAAGTAAGTVLGGPAGGLAGGVAGALAGHFIGNEIGDAVGKKTGYGIKKRRSKKIKDAEPPFTDNDDGAVMEGEGLIVKAKRGGGGWIDHVKAYAKQHGISYKRALKEAKESYHGGKGGAKKSSFNAEIMHRINASKPEKAAGMNVLSQDHYRGKLAAMDPNDDSSYITQPLSVSSGRGLRWGTPIHAHFHRRKAKILKDELEKYKEGTKQHYHAKRRYEKRQAIADAAWHSATNPETQYKFKEYKPIYKDKDPADYPHRKHSKWITHVKAFSRHRGISYKEAMSHPEAKDAYRKGKFYDDDYAGGDEDAAPPAPAPVMKRARKQADAPAFAMSLRPRKGKGLAAHIASLPFV